MARILGYIAASLDGFIATSDEKLDWLMKHSDADLGDLHYNRFLEEIDIVVMGRATYDWVRNEGQENPYPGKRTIVASSHPLEGAPAHLERWERSIDALVEELRRQEGNVWMVGGGKLQMAFLERDALDEMHIFFAPNMLGGGVPLFPPTGHVREARLLQADKRGPFAHLHYAFTS